jgi:hypothetical protein
VEVRVDWAIEARFAWFGRYMVSAPLAVEAVRPYAIRSSRPRRLGRLAPGGAIHGRGPPEGFSRLWVRLRRVGLFGNKEKKAAEEAAGAAEVERLGSLSTEELAVELMPAFGPDGAKAKGRAGSNAMTVIQWLVRDYPRHPSLRPLADSVPVALQRLTAAGLLKASGSGIGAAVDSYSLTPAGEEARAEGSVEQRLAGS